MTVNPTAGTAAERGARGGQPSRLAASLSLALLVVLAAPFVYVSFALLGGLPGRVWPEDFTVPASINGAAYDVMEYPDAKISKPKKIEPDKGAWLGFRQPDLIVENNYELVEPLPLATLINFYRNRLPTQAWRAVGDNLADPNRRETRLEYRRKGLGLIVVLPAADPETIIAGYYVRVGAFNGAVFVPDPSR